MINIITNHKKLILKIKFKIFFFKKNYVIQIL